MGLSGKVAGAAHKRLQEQLAQQLLQEQLADRQRQQQFSNQMTLRNQEQEDRRFAADTTERTRMADERAADRRLESNRWGVADLEKQGKEIKVLDALERIKDPESGLTPQQRWMEAEVAGFTGGDPDDFETTEERETREQRTRSQRLKDVEEEENVRGRVRSRYKDPDDPTELLIGPDGKQKLATKREAAGLIDQGYEYVAGGTRGTGKAGRGAEGGQSASVASNVLNEIAKLSEQINTEGVRQDGNVLSRTKDALWATGVGKKREYGAGMNLDNPVAEYQSLTTGFIPMLARAVGHVGVLTQQDVDSVRALLPLPTDGRELAANKLKRARRLIERMTPEEMEDLPLMPGEGGDGAGAAGAAPTGGKPLTYQDYLAKRKGGK